MEKHWLKSYPPGVRPEIDINEYPSLKELIERGLAIHSVRDAYVQMGKAMTYGELDILSMQFGAFLQHSCGLKKGDRIAVMMPNTLQYPIAIHGALRAGFTVVNTNPLYTARELEHQLSDSGATVIVILENFAHVLQEVIAHTPIKHVIVTSVGEMLGFPKGNIVDFVVRHKRKQVKPYSLPGSKSFKQALKEGSKVRLQPVKLTHSRYRVSAVHRRHHRRRQGRHAHPRQHGRERAAGARVDRPVVPARSGHAHHRAAAVSHLRADRELPAVRDSRLAQRAHHQSA